MTVHLVQETRVAPSQTRIIPILLTQATEFSASALPLELSILSADRTTQLHIDLPVTHIPKWGASTFTPMVSTYFFAETTPTAFVAVPPKESNHGKALPPLMFLRTSSQQLHSFMTWLTVSPSV